MALFEKITEDIKTAMREKDKEKLESLRAVKSALLLEKTKGGSGDISEEDEIKLLQKLVKQRKESGEIYQQQGRADLAADELKQAAYIEVYLPTQLSEQEIEDEIKAIINETGASSMKDMGKVMGMATKKLAGKADGKIIAAKVKSFLG